MEPLKFQDPIVLEPLTISWDAVAKEIYANNEDAACLQQLIILRKAISQLVTRGTSHEVRLPTITTIQYNSLQINSTQSSFHDREVKRSDISNHFVLSYGGSLLHCLLEGKHPLTASGPGSCRLSSTEIVPSSSQQPSQTRNHRLDKIVSSCASQVQLTFFQFIHDLLTLKGIAQSWTSDMKDVARIAVSSRRDQEFQKTEKTKPSTTLLSSTETSIELPEESRSLSCSLSLNSGGLCGSQSQSGVQLGDMVIQRDSLSGKVKVKPRDVITTRGGSLLISETETIRKQRYQDQIRELQSECTKIGISSPESIKIGTICSETLITLIDHHLAPATTGSRMATCDRREYIVNDDGSNDYNISEDVNGNTVNQIETSFETSFSIGNCTSSETDPTSWSTQLSNNFILLVLRLLTINDLNARTQVLKLCRLVLVHCDKSTLSQFSRVLGGTLQRLFPLFLIPSSIDHLQVYLETVTLFCIRIYEPFNEKLYFTMTYLLDHSQRSISGYPERLLCFLRHTRPILLHQGYFLSRHASEWINLCFEALDYYSIELCIESLLTIISIMECIPAIFWAQFRKGLMLRLLGIHSTLIYPKVNGTEVSISSICQVNDKHDAKEQQYIHHLEKLIRVACEHFGVEHVMSDTMTDQLRESVVVLEKNKEQWRYKPEHLRQFIQATCILANEQIQFPTVRIVTEFNAHIGDFSSTDALNLARSKCQDLILLSATTVPPVCKIGSLKKHLAITLGSRPFQSVVAFDPGQSVKFIRFSIKEDVVAFQRKIDLARRFLAYGFETNVIIQSKAQSVATTLERIQLIAIQLKDVGIPLKIPNATSEISGFAVIQLQFKPSTRDVPSPKSGGIERLVYDDLPVKPQQKKH